MKQAIVFASLALSTSALAGPRHGSAPTEPVVAPARTATGKPVVARPSRVAARAPARRVKTYDFTGDALDASRLQPDGTTLFVTGPVRFGSLIDLRGDFLHEIASSTDRL